MVSFEDKLRARLVVTGSRLCVGLDPRPELVDGDLGGFLRRVVEETSPFAAAFKPNLAYFEALGSGGLALLEEVRAAIPEEIPVILDAKRGDIGETQRYYAKALFDTWRADAATVSPWMGFDSVEPFLRHEGRGTYLLALTSNAGAADLQRRESGGRALFERVFDFSARAREEGLPGTLGFVVGLTQATPEVLAQAGPSPLLVPGLGAQGGDLAALAGRPADCLDVINVSRGILFLEPERELAEKARDYADRIADIA